MNTKFVFLDVDGTLVNFKAEVPRSTIEAMNKARENGHKMILATGRQKSQIYPWLLEQVKFDGILASSSAYIEIDGKAVFESRPTKEKFEKLIDFFEENGIHYYLQSKDVIYGNELSIRPILDALEEAQGKDEMLSGLFGTATILEDPKALTCIEKVAYDHSPFTTKELQDILGDYYYIVNYSIGDTENDHHGEITFDGVHKGNGVKRYMELVGAPIEDSIAVGDSENDLEMIKAAGIGVCMGNGFAPVKEAADYVTTHIDEDGIFNAFQHLGLI